MATYSWSELVGLPTVLSNKVHLSIIMIRLHYLAISAVYMVNYCAGILTILLSSTMFGVLE